MIDNGFSKAQKDYDAQLPPEDEESNNPDIPECSGTCGYGDCERGRDNK